MRVYKFGGASIVTPAAMKSLFNIIRNAPTPLIIVVSAFGKTTNALEQVAHAANSVNKDLAQRLLVDIELSHNNYALELLGEAHFQKLLPRLQEFYTEIQWAIDDGGIQSKDYVYDQIVCVGELLSTTLFSEYLISQGLENQWLDARDMIKTDNVYREPNVDIEASTQQTQQIVTPILQQVQYVVTQGFIGCTDENNSTTLGREGSDYSAALFAAMLQAESVTIWKDVKGLYNADPRLFPNAVQIAEISYNEVIEMAYFGAQVIHPKTIKPLENKNIPLYVKCFLDETIQGTCIKKEIDAYQYPPIIVVKKNQVLMNIQSRDLSFITDDNISKIYNFFAANQVKINLMQNSAINLRLGVSNEVDRLAKLVDMLNEKYIVTLHSNVEILTVRHYTNAILEDVLRGKIKLLEQKTPNTIRVVVQ
jgi:aspartate kinase